MRLREFSAWLVHLVTASGAIVGLFALHAITQQDYVLAFWLMAIAILIDAVDGTFARLLNVDIVAPSIDGHMLDNIVDYLNYAVVPAYFIFSTNLVSAEFSPVLAALVVLVSAYQFSQVDAKTTDFYFKGFPSYWNIVVFYLYILKLPVMTNAIIIVLLMIAIFVPVKYVYPTRLEGLSKKAWLRMAFLVATIAWGLIILELLWQFPDVNRWLLNLSLFYVALYFGVSIYLTYRVKR